MDFESILELVDDFGTYQRLLLGFVLLPGFLPCGFHAYNQIFMAATPADYWCNPHPVLHLLNLSSQQIKLVTIPRETVNGIIEIDKCKMNDIPFLKDYPNLPILRSQVLEILEGDAVNITWPSINCEYGWSYENSNYRSTVVTEWNLVCQKSLIPTIALIVFGLGGLLGMSVFGWIQDKWGRRPAFFIYLLIGCFFGIGTALSPNLLVWFLCRFGVGWTVPAITGTPFVLGMELVGPKSRTLSTILLNVAYSVSLISLAGVAYCARRWRELALLTSLPFTCFFVYFWVLPESPRWLLAHGRINQAENVLRHMASINGRILPNNFKQILLESYEVGMTRNSYKILDLFKGPQLRRNTILITSIWLINMGVYVGLSYYAPSLGGNEAWNFFIAGFAEFPTYVFLWRSMEYWGRRWTLLSSMVIGGAACISIVVVKPVSWMTLSLYGLGKFGVSAGFVAIQQMAAEIYPTVVRGIGISFSNVVGMMGPTLVPIVTHMGVESLALPLLVLGCFMMIGGILGLALPETLGRPLPQTLADAEVSTQSVCVQTTEEEQ